MKHKILGSMSVLALCFALAPMTQVVASEKSATIVAPKTASDTTIITAFNLSNLASNGYLQEQGIPSGSQLSFAIATGQITAQEIVEAAVRAKRVSSDVLTDQTYTRAIEYNLAPSRISD